MKQAKIIKNPCPACGRELRIYEDAKSYSATCPAETHCGYSTRMWKKSAATKEDGK